MKVRIDHNGKSAKADIPEKVPSDILFPVVVDGKEDKAIWDGLTRCLFLVDTSARLVVEKPIRVRYRAFEQAGDDGTKSFVLETVTGSIDPIHRLSGQIGYDFGDSPIKKRAQAGGEEQLRSPIAGKIIAILAEPGHQVAAGQDLFVIEAMKMENRVSCRTSGVLRKVPIAVGDMVATNTLLARIGPE